VPCKKLLLPAAFLFFACAQLFADTAFNFSLPSVDVSKSDNKGAVINLSDFKGQVVFLDFFATWCPPCKASVPAVEAFYQKNKGRFAVIGVNVREDLNGVADFVRDNGVKYPVVIADKQTADAFNINAIPAFFIIDKNGSVAKIYHGFAPGMEKNWQDDIDALLRK
jgi:thiol-disulfide isomerase/thioredoxin